LDPRQRNYIEKADRSAEGLLGIINDILDFSKIMELSTENGWIGNITVPGRSYHLDHCHQVPESDSNCPGIEAERSERDTLRRRGPGIAQGIAA
jgi:signal transduction histidine kinase